MTGPLTPTLRFERNYAIATGLLLLFIFALAVFGRSLQHWLESLVLLRWFGVVLIGALALAMLAWLIRSAAVLPRWRAGVVALAAATLLGWGATFERPEETMHLLLFGLLGILAARAFGLRAGLPVVALCAGADELLQLYLPDRVGDWPDVRKNTAAGAVGWLLAWAQEGRQDG